MARCERFRNLPSLLMFAALLLGPVPLAHGQAPAAGERTASNNVSALRSRAMSTLAQYRKRPAPLGTLALERLARAGDRSAREALLARAKETQGAAAVASLLRLGERSQISRAVELLTDRTLNDPPELFSALADAKATSAGRAIVPWLNVSDDQTIADAAIALARLGYADAAPALRTLRTGPNPLLRPAALAALWRLGDRTLQPALEEALQNMLPEVRLLAAQAWAPESNGPWTGAVQKLLRDPHPPRRIAAGRLLAVVAPGAVRDVLGQDMVTLADPALRGEAAGVFETVATPADTGALAKALDSDVAEVRVHAAGAILRLAAKEPSGDRDRRSSGAHGR